MPNPITNISLNPSFRRFSTHFNNFVFQNIIFFPFYFLQVDYHTTIRPISSTFPHTIFSEAIPILLNFLVLKFQNQQNSPFQTHNKTVLFGIVSLLLYNRAYDFQQRISPINPRSRLARVIYHCMMLFGYLSFASLASLLFPDSARPAIYVLYITLSVGELLPLVYQRIGTRRFGRTHFDRERRYVPTFLISPWRLVAQRTLNQRQLLPIQQPRRNLS